MSSLTRGASTVASGSEVRVRIRVQACLHTTRLASVRCSHDSRFAARFVLPQHDAACLAGLLIPRSQVRSLPAHSL